MDSGLGSKLSASGSVRLQRSQCLFQQFVSDATAGLRFSQDALGASSVPYTKADFQQLFRPSGALKPSSKRKTRKRKVYRPALGSPEEFRTDGLLPLQLQTVELLQDSCRRTSPAAARSDVSCLKRASGLSKPVYKGAQRDQDQILLDKCSEYHKDLQSWSSITPQRRTDQDRMVTPTHTSTESLKTDLTNPEDQVQTEVLISCCSPTAVSRPPQSDSAASDVDSWLAAHCSPLEGDQSQRLIQRLVAQLFVCENEEPVAQDQPPNTPDQPPNSKDQPPHSKDQPLDTQLIVSVLLHLSSRTTLVRSLLAEQLNSSEWRHRLLSCQTLCSLRGPINKDIVNKLTHVMFNDRTDAVRHAAAETLLKLGKTHRLHTELRLKLEEGQSPRGRMEALDMIGHLKLMTVALREPLMSCFCDEVTAACRQACVMAECLLLTDETVENRLLQLVENDTAAEVRLSAIRAVGALGLSSLDVQKTLLRCVETEKEAELRLAACHLLQSCGVPSDQLHHFLLQRVQYESNWLVCRTMKEMLRLCRLQEEPSDTQFNLQVEHLCGSRLVTEKLLLLEKLQVGGRRLRSALLARWLSWQYMINNHQTADQH